VTVAGVDTIRAIFTYLIATLVVVGGGAILFTTQSSDLRVVVGGFIGFALNFVFGSEVQTRTARQAAASTAAATGLSPNGSSGGG
jgi:hypothetical protein